MEGVELNGYGQRPNLPAADPGQAGELEDQPSRDFLLETIWVISISTCSLFLFQQQGEKKTKSGLET